MSIIYEGFGNILTHPAQTITVPVNTVGIMGKGLALSFRNRIKGLNEYYKGCCERGSLSTGLCEVYPIPETNRQVLMFPSKGHWKDPSKLSDIEQGLYYLTTHYQSLNIKELAIPPIGCGLGKLDFTTEVKPLLYHYLNELPIDVYILHRELD